MEANGVGKHHTVVRDDEQCDDKRCLNPKCVWRTYRPEEILPSVGEDSHRMAVLEFEGVTYTANFSSLKLRTFKRSLKCVGCGLIGVEFRLESENYEHHCEKLHLNLYSEDGVLMTKDHIIPVCKGGWNDLDNTQTMCAKCNVEKGSTSHVRYSCGMEDGADGRSLLSSVIRQEDLINIMGLDSPEGVASRMGSGNQTGE